MSWQDFDVTGAVMEGSTAFLCWEDQRRQLDVRRGDEDGKWVVSSDWYPVDGPTRFIEFWIEIWRDGTWLVRQSVEPGLPVVGPGGRVNLPEQELSFIFSGVL